MSFDFWVAAEKWFESTAGIILAVIIFVLFIMAFALTRYKTKIGKRILGGGAIIVAVLGVVSVMNNQKYDEYLEISQHVTPVIRTQTYNFFGGYQPLSRSEVGAYKRYHDPVGIEATGLYEKEEVTIPLTYVGKYGRHHYFEHEGELFRQYENTVSFEPSAAETQIIGSLYHLKNREFETIGFQDTEFIFYEKIVIAEEDTGKTIEVEDENLIPNTKGAFYFWTFPYY